MSTLQPQSSLSQHLPHSTLTPLFRARHSTRAFLPTPIPTPLLEEVLSLAQHSPSNSNTQPWRLHILTGNALSRLSTALFAKAESGAESTVKALPDEYRHYRSELGRKLYGPEGYNVDRAGSLKKSLRNYTFFEAPVGAVVCMDAKLGTPDVLSVGMYLQSIFLLLEERGVASCSIVSVVGYPDVVREVLGLGDDMLLLTGLAIGYEDEGERVNGMRTTRDEWTKSVVFQTE